MNDFLFYLYAFIRFGCEVFVPPETIDVIGFLNSWTIFFDEKFQQSSPNNARFFTLCDSILPPPYTVLIGRYRYVKTDMFRGVLHRVDQTAPVPDDLNENPLLFQKNWRDLDSFEIVNNVDGPPAALDSWPQNTNVPGAVKRISDTDGSDIENLSNLKGARPNTDTTLPDNRTSPVEVNVDDSYTIVRGSDGYYIQPPEAAKPVKATNFLLNPMEIRHVMMGNGLERKIFVFRLLVPPKISQIMEIATDELKDILKFILRECAEAILYRNKVDSTFDDEFQVMLREKIAFCTHTYEVRCSGWFFAHNGNYYYCDDGSKAPEDHIIFKSGFSFRRGKFLKDRRETAKAGWDILRLAKMETIGILFLFTHLGLLYTLFEEAGYPPRVLLFVEGPTGSLKTAVASLMFNFSGLQEQRIPATFRDTSASMEIKFAKYRDRILLVDDFCPAADASSRRVMEKSLEQLVRFFGDGIAKGRATPSMTEVKELKPCGLVAMTGEDSAGSQSSLLRCLFLPVAKDSFDKHILQHYQEDPSLWTEYLAQFVSQVSPVAKKSSAISGINSRFIVQKRRSTCPRSGWSILMLVCRSPRTSQLKWRRRN